MKKQEFKKKVLKWLTESGIDISGKKIRVYNYRGDWEVRIYNEPMEIPNRKKSRRKIEKTEDGYNCTYGIHSQMITTYTYISETDFNSPEEREFILRMLKDN